jgi:hypothetical protein
MRPGRSADGRQTIGQKYGGRTFLRQQLGHDLGAVGGRLARGVDRLGDALAQGTVVVDAGEAEIGEGEAPQTADGVVGRQGARPHVVEQLSQGRLVHDPPSIRDIGGRCRPAALTSR